MKKILSAILCLLLIFSLFACTKNEETHIERGMTEGNSYTNSFAKLVFKAPESWTFASNEELLSHTEHAGKLLDTERLNEIFEEFGLAYDMSCYSPDGIHSIGVLFVKNDHEEFKNYSSTDELLRAMIEQTGLDTSAGIARDNIKLGKETYLRLCAETKTHTGDTGYATFYAKKEGNVTIIIVSACTDDFTVSDCEACFA